MPLVVHEISFVDEGCLMVPDLAAQPEDESQSFATCSTLPYGYNNDVEQLKRRCSEYVNTVCKYPLNSVETIIGDTSGIIWQTLRAVWRFDQVNPVAKKASTTLTFTMFQVRATGRADISGKCFSAGQSLNTLKFGES
jgi:hypothetical protein